MDVPVHRGRLGYARKVTMGKQLNGSDSTEPSVDEEIPRSTDPSAKC